MRGQPLYQNISAGCVSFPQNGQVSRNRGLNGFDIAAFAFSSEYPHQRHRLTATGLSAWQTALGRGRFLAPRPPRGREGGSGGHNKSQ